MNKIEKILIKYKFKKTCKKFDNLIFKKQLWKI